MSDSTQSVLLDALKTGKYGQSGPKLNEKQQKAISGSAFRRIIEHIHAELYDGSHRDKLRSCRIDFLSSDFKCEYTELGYGGFTLHISPGSDHGKLAFKVINEEYYGILENQKDRQGGPNVNNTMVIAIGNIVRDTTVAKFDTYTRIKVKLSDFDFAFEPPTTECLVWHCKPVTEYGTWVFKVLYDMLIASELTS